jgi:hypothetical protein
LHPRLEEFFPPIRSAFHNATVNVLTNGILLSSKGESFWRSCAEHKIGIVVTIYPDMERQFEEAVATGASFGVSVSPYDAYTHRYKITKTSHHCPMDFSGSQPKLDNFMLCWHGQNCAMLREGRMYPCPVASNIHIFNDYFPEHALPLSNEDSIDIYAAKSGREVLEFISRPIPFCRFCLVSGRTSGHPWGCSRKSIREWTV